LPAEAIAEAWGSAVVRSRSRPRDSSAKLDTFSIGGAVIRIIAVANSARALETTGRQCRNRRPSMPLWDRSIYSRMLPTEAAVSDAIPDDRFAPNLVNLWLEHFPWKETSVERSTDTGVADSYGMTESASSRPLMRGRVRDT
jgi:hypothetical protein